MIYRLRDKLGASGRVVKNFSCRGTDSLCYNPRRGKLVRNDFRRIQLRAIWLTRQCGDQNPTDGAIDVEGNIVMWSNQFLAEGHCWAPLVLTGTSNGPRGYGLAAAADVAPGELMFVIPREIWYPCSAEVALCEARQNAPQLLHRLAELNLPDSFRDGFCLALNLMMKLVSPQVTHTHDPYFNFLNYNALNGPMHPLIRPEYEIDLLQDTQIYKALSQRRTFYRHVLNALIGENNTIADKLLECMCIVLSRAVASTGGNKHSPFTLVPLLDLMNHSEHHNCVHTFDNHSHSFFVHSTRNISAGDELCLNYGSERDNSSFFCIYGFVQPNNLNDIIRIALTDHAKTQDSNLAITVSVQQLKFQPDQILSWIRRLDSGESCGLVISLHSCVVCVVDGIIGARNEETRLKTLHTHVDNLLRRTQQKPQPSHRVDQSWAQTCEIVRSVEADNIRLLLQYLSMHNNNNKPFNRLVLLTSSWKS